MLIGHDASAQVLYGSIVGTVTDSAGAVVPGAIVKATQTQTNQMRTAATNDSGVYTLSTVPAGTYIVTISKQGFAPFQATDIILAINATARVDAKLTVGGQAETVTVSAETAQLETDRIDVHANVSSEELQQLPQPTRTYEGLLGLLPGVAPPNPQWAGGGGTNNPDRSMIINVNGTSASGTAVSVDGVSAVNPWVQFYSTAVPSTDAIETVNTVTASSGADQGVMNGGAVRIQIKSGTNSFHGSTYWTNVNNAMKAAPYFTPSGSKKPKYIDNDTGGTIGRPVIKNKLFFFASYEGDFLRQAQGSNYTLPTPQMTKGILASPTPIYNPATGNADGSGRTTFPQDANGNYIIPTSSFATASSILLSHVPSGVPDGKFANNIYINTPYLYDLHKVDSKVDWDATSKLRLTGRYSTYPYKQSKTPAFGNILGPGDGSNTDQHGNIYSVAAMATYVATPNLVIDALFGITHSAQYLFPPSYSTLYGQETLKIPGTNLGPLPSAGGVPQFNFSGGLNSFGYGYPALTYRDPVFQYTGNVTWVKKNHSIRFGVDVSQQHMNHQEVTPTYFSFTGGLTGLYCQNTTSPGCQNGSPATGEFNSFADFLLGLPQSASNSELTVNWVTLRTWQFAPYVSDTWQVNRKLTVYAGTGWDYLPVPHRDGRGIEYYNPDTNVYEFCGVGGVAGDCGISVQKYLFAPRAGLAYRVKPNTVIRAGYSLAPEQISMSRDGLYNYPSTITQSLSGTNGNTAATTLTNGLPTLTAPDISKGTLTLPSTIGVATPAKHFIRGYTESYNVTVQQQLGWNLLAQVGYVGTLTVHQHTRANINYGLVGGGQASQILNQKFGVTAGMTEVLAFEHMNYQSLQAQLQKRMANGLQFQASYTWSKWMGLCCDEQGDGNPQILIPEYMHLTWALMPDDRTHNFELSAIYELPFGKGKKYATSGMASAIAGGWQTNWVLARYSGTPFTVTAPGDSLNAPGNSQVADKVKSNVAIKGANGLASPYFDTTAFAAVSQARFGTAGFDSLRGPGYGNLDTSLFRTFPIKDALKMQFRLEALNIINHPNFGNPDSGVTDGSFGLISSTNAGSRLIAERFLRLGLKFTF
ncbi:MAG: carboxypeptidase regulatory-like domain-containing protein [Acidobacteriaceae bacterium]|nr:carboxypeptidase regulatory-like domain-containing protein [Acidobacteriaceae bacterium]